VLELHETRIAAMIDDDLTSEGGRNRMDKLKSWWNSLMAKLRRGGSDQTAKK